MSSSRCRAPARAVRLRIPSLRKLLGLGKRGCLTLCRKQAKVMGESL